ncbi:MAG: DUF3313 domain-containing protein [Verrucomicrobiaceae bacterium]|nr:MAG: DUF3313 domain-containing protein [Verrucomicrobiaceae bacterium]
MQEMGCPTDGLSENLTIDPMQNITRLALLSAAGAALTLSSCSTGGRSPSGFLSNYAQLDGGHGTADAVSAYVKPGVDLKKYDSVIIDPVTTVVAAPGISPQVKDQLAAYLAGAVRSQIGGELRIASAPGPTTLRVRTALTDVVEGQTSGKPVTTVHSGASATLTGSLGSPEVASFISNVSFEGEILDSVTGERLSALADHRIGAKREATTTTTWAGVRSAINQAVGKLHSRFNAVRAR